MIQPKPLILTADDEADICLLMRRILEPDGYEVISAGDGNQTLALVAERSPEMVLLDIKMPGKDGMQVLNELRSHYEDIPVIMVSAVGDMRVALETLNMGAYDYLIKPFNSGEVANSVKRALERKRLIKENRDYQQNLEKKVLEQTEHLNRRIQELQGLNTMFQKHLSVRAETEAAYMALAVGVSQLADEAERMAQNVKQPVAFNHQSALELISRIKTDLRRLADQAEPIISRMRLPPAQRI